jgi:hypothetical protein
MELSTGQEKEGTGNAPFRAAREEGLVKRKRRGGPFNGLKKGRSDQVEVCLVLRGNLFLFL